MDPNLYRAASEGKFDVLRQHIDKLVVQTTPNENTALHVAAQFGHLQCVAVILELCPSLLRRINNKKETPLHVASRGGYPSIVKALIDRKKEVGVFMKEMLKAINVDGDTALHMAVRNRNVEMVILLTREDPWFLNVANKAEETPLYLAAEGGYNEIVFEILQTCVSPAYSGPGGRTALHAALGINPCLTEIAAKLLEWNPDLIKKADVCGWTPLHYAARYQNFGAVEKMLQMDKSVAYVLGDTPNYSSFETPNLGYTPNYFSSETPNLAALHIAATHGYVSIMDEILLHCPDCWEIIARRGENILHIAVNLVRENVIEYILQKSWSRHLINQKDIDGNTPLHLLAASECETRGLWKHDIYSKLWEHEGADLRAFNNRNMTPVEVKLSYAEVDYFLEPQMGGERNAIINYGDNIEKWKYDRRKQKSESEEEARAQREAERKVKHKAEAKARLEERARSEAKTKDQLEEGSRSEAQTKARSETETKSRLEDNAKEIDIVEV